MTLGKPTIGFSVLQFPGVNNCTHLKGLWLKKNKSTLHIMSIAKYPAYSVQRKFNKCQLSSLFTVGDFKWKVFFWILSTCPKNGPSVSLLVLSAFDSPIDSRVLGHVFWALFYTSVPISWSCKGKIKLPSLVCKDFNRNELIIWSIRSPIPWEWGWKPQGLGVASGACDFYSSTGKTPCSEEPWAWFHAHPEILNKVWMIFIFQNYVGGYYDWRVLIRLIETVLKAYSSFYVQNSL